MSEIKDTKYAISYSFLKILESTQILILLANMAIKLQKRLAKRPLI